MIEREKKVLLTEQEYNCLFAVLSRLGKTITQINRYFDTVDLQNHMCGITYRVREKDGVYTATVKQHCFGSCDCSQEQSFSVDDPYDISPFQMDRLIYQGMLVTERTKWSSEDGVQICLDKNMYLETTDYELEIEYENEEMAKMWMQRIAAIMAADGVLCLQFELFSRAERAESKSNRFFERKIKVDQEKRV